MEEIEPLDLSNPLSKPQTREMENSTLISEINVCFYFSFILHGSHILLYKLDPIYNGHQKTCPNCFFKVLDPTESHFKESSVTLNLICSVGIC
jgi:hypothetical protein